MSERFVREARAVVANAQAEARAGGSSTVEAEHVLLALAADTPGVVSDVLRSSGLDRAALQEALDAEFARSLSAAGVSFDAISAPRRVPFAERPRWGTSAKSALERALSAAHARGDRRIRPGHVLLGVLGATEGTVPRALRGVGTEPADLAAATHAALDRALG